MQLFLTKVQGTDADSERHPVPLYPEQAEIGDDMNNAEPLIVSENGKYKLTIELDRNIVNKATVYLNAEDDIQAIGVAFVSGVLLDPNDLRESLTGKYWFIGQVDIVRFHVKVEFKDGSPDQWFSSGDILCNFENEQDFTNVRQIVESLLNFDDEYINNILYSSAPVQQGNMALQRGELIKYSFKSLPSFIEIIKNISSTYHRHLPFFRRKAHYRVEPGMVQMDGLKVSDVSPQTVHWLAQNMGALAPVKFNTGIRHEGRCYFPGSVEAETRVYSRNVYENKVILGFLRSVLQKTHKILNQVRRGIKAGESYISSLYGGMGQHVNATTKPPIVIAHQLICARQSTLYNQLHKLQVDLALLYDRYQKCLECDEITLSRTPRATKVIMQTPAYHEIYLAMIQWFNYGEFCLSGASLTFKIKNFTKIFEYYCLIRLIRKIMAEGFILSNRKPCTYIYPPPNNKYEMEQEVCNTYTFRREDMLLTLYYEPVLYGFLPEQPPSPNSLMPNDVGLVRSRDTRTRQNYWEPDFVIKLEHDSSSDYVILDAKYSSTSSIIGCDNGPPPEKQKKTTVQEEGKLKDIINKYYVDTAALGQGRIRMVWTLQGRSDSQFYEYGNLLSHFAALGCTNSFGNCPVNSNPDIDSIDALWDEMEAIIPALRHQAQIAGMSNVPKQVQTDGGYDDETKSADAIPDSALYESDHGDASYEVSEGGGMTPTQAQVETTHTQESGTHTPLEPASGVAIDTSLDFCHMVWTHVKSLTENLIKNVPPSFNKRPPIRKDTLSRIYKVSKQCSIDMKISSSSLKLIAVHKRENRGKPDDEEKERFEECLRKELGGKLSFEWEQSKQALTLTVFHRPDEVDDPEKIAQWFVRSCEALAPVLCSELRV